MKFSTMAFALGASVLLAACSQGRPKSPAPAAVGFWEGEMVTSTRGNFLNESVSTSTPSWRIDENSVSLTNHCVDGTPGNFVALTATSPARISGNKIIIERTDVKSTASGNAACEARVDQGEYPYEIVDGKMIVTLKGGAKIAFKRLSAEKAKKEIDYSEAGVDTPGFSFPPTN